MEMFVFKSINRNWGSTFQCLQFPGLWTLCYKATNVAHIISYSAQFGLSVTQASNIVHSIS